MPTGGELGEHLETTIDALVRSGRYDTRADVLREGVRLVEEREARLARLDEALDLGLCDAEAGRSEALDIVARRLGARWDRVPDIRRP